jgi:hypothetical protein
MCFVIFTGEILFISFLLIIANFIIMIIISNIRISISNLLNQIIIISFISNKVLSSQYVLLIPIHFNHFIYINPFKYFQLMLMNYHRVFNLDTFFILCYKTFCFFLIYPFIYIVEFIKLHSLLNKICCRFYLNYLF